MTVCILSNYGSEFQICSNVRMRMINIIFYKEALNQQGRQFDHRSGALDLTKWSKMLPIICAIDLKR